MQWLCGWTLSRAHTVMSLADSQTFRPSALWPWTDAGLGPAQSTPWTHSTKLHLKLELSAGRVTFLDSGWGLWVVVGVYKTVGGALPRGLVEHACVCIVCSFSALSASQLWLCRPALCRGFSLPVDVCPAELHLFRRSMHLGLVEVLQKQLSLSKGYSNPRLIVDCVMLMVSMLFECDSTRTAVCCELSLGET